MRIVNGEAFKVSRSSLYVCRDLTGVLPFEGNPVLVERVLEVVKGKLCYIVGTVYMDMPLKPNVIEDVARDVRQLVYSIPL
jgi:hypothetical protein